MVIIGGGFAGSEVAKHLQYLFQVDLVDDRDYFEFTPSALRALVQPTKASSLQRAFPQFLPHCRTHMGTVTRIDSQANMVHFTSSQSGGDVALPFDFAVIATGVSFAFKSRVRCRGSRSSPNELMQNPHVISSSRIHSLIATHMRVRTSGRVLVIGGGYVGLELAAELADMVR